MGLFTRLFGSGNQAMQPKVKFGRYTDAYKTTQQYNAWDESQDLFEEGDYLKAYRAFLDYLRDEDIENVKFQQTTEGLNFQLFQGSKIIRGIANGRQVIVEAKIAQTKTLYPAFMERLLQSNFDLKYSRFALDEAQQLTIKFDTYTIDGSPYKLYYALKELATNADKQDDLLQDEFQQMIPVGVDHLKIIDAAEKEAKYDFIHQQLSAVTGELLDHGKPITEYPGAVGYILLNTSYKLDYLTCPEGFMMECLERIHRLYFAKNDQTTGEKVAVVQGEFQQLLNRPKEDYFKEMYLTTSTFGITNPVSHDRVVGLIDGELKNMDWYEEHGYFRTALAIPGYIVGYCLFNYAIPLPDRSFFHLYYQIIEIDYFKSLGYDFEYYNPINQQFNKKAIRKAVKRLAQQNHEYFPKLNPDLSMLNYESLPGFAKSYLLMVRHLNMTQLT